jgi:hypothetical protein
MSELALVLIAIIALYLWSFFADAPHEQGDRASRRQGENKPGPRNSLL